MTVKIARIQARLSPEHKALIENAAALSGQSLSAFVVSSVLERVHQATQTRLSRRDWDRFLEIMDRETEPTPALVKAARAQREA